MGNPVVLVVGAGPGVGAAVARRFGATGYDVSLIARSPDRLDELGTRLEGEGLTVGWTPADITDAGACTAAARALCEHTGRLDVLHFNPSAFRQHDPLTLTAAELLEDVALGAGALLTAVQAVRPFMERGGRVVATGSMAADRPWHEAASLGVQKAALRNLVRSLDTTLAPDGIRAATVTVRGTLATEGPFAHDHVAEAIYRTALTSDDDWRVEVPFDGYAGPEEA